MRIFGTGLLGGLAAGVLALSASTAYGVTITPYNTLVSGASSSMSFVANASAAAVSCSESEITGFIVAGPANDIVPLYGIVFDDCVTSYLTTAEIRPHGSWELVAVDSAGNGYVSVGGATVDTGICSISVGAQDVDGWVDDVADELHVHDTSVSYTASPFLTCMLVGVGTNGNATFSATNAVWPPRDPYHLDVDLEIS